MMKTQVLLNSFCKKTIFKSVQRLKINVGLNMAAIIKQSPCRYKQISQIYLYGNVLKMVFESSIEP